MTARVLRLDPAAHRAAQALLPWYAAGALEPPERARVEAHLAVCGVCRRELDFERRLRVAQSELPPGDAWERSLARVRRRLDDEGSGAAAGEPGAASTAESTPMPTGSAAAAAAAAAASTSPASLSSAASAVSGASSASQASQASPGSPAAETTASPSPPSPSSSDGSRTRAPAMRPATVAGAALPGNTPHAGAPTMPARAARTTRRAARERSPARADRDSPRPARGWLAAARAAVLLALVPMLLDAPGPSPEPYRALGPRPAVPAARVLVRFRPEATELQMRHALRASGARLLDGPTASDAYLLGVSPGGEALAVDRLRAEAAVELAVSLAPAGAGSAP